MCGAGSWEGLSLTLKLLQIVLDGLEGCGLVADNVLMLSGDTSSRSTPLRAVRSTPCSGGVNASSGSRERFEWFALLTWSLRLVRTPIKGISLEDTLIFVRARKTAT